MTRSKYLNEKNRIDGLKKQMVVDIETIDHTGDLIYAARHSKEAYYITATQGTSYREIGITCKFVDRLPTGIDYISKGYLLYDITTELFVGSKGAWVEQVRDILIEGDDINFPIDKDDETVPRFSIIVLYALARGNEVVLVPCTSYESRVDDALHIYQEFNWQSTFGLKSRSGKLSIM